MLLGMGLFTTLDVHTPIDVLVVFHVVQGLGMGLLYCTYVRSSASSLSSLRSHHRTPLTLYVICSAR